MAEIIIHEPGVYLNLREADYLADSSLGSDALKTVWKNPPEWWWHSAFNNIAPPPPKDTKAFALGTAAHVRFLDGPAVYDEVYGVIPTKAEHPHHLDTIPELKAACRGHGLGVSGDKDELIMRLLHHNPDEKILLEVQRQLLRAGKRLVSRADDATVRLVYEMAMRSRDQLRLGEEGGELTLRQAFEGGLSEVSIFWRDENDIPHRARLDKVKPNITLDFKTFSDWKRSSFKQELLDEIVRRGYVLQGVQYNEGRHQLRKFVAEGRVFGGTKEQREILEEIAEAEAWAWGWVFAKTSGYPAVRGIVIRDWENDLRFAKAAEIRQEALANFVYYREFFEGFDQMWFDPELVWEPENEDWPSFSVIGE